MYLYLCAKIRKSIQILEYEDIKNQKNPLESYGKRKKRQIPIYLFSTSN